MKAGPERELAERYLDRVTKAGSAVGLTFAGIHEVPEGRAKSESERKREEAAKLMEIAGDGVLILLDERGRNITSRQFSQKLSAYRDGGAQRLTIAIGGPDGHDASVRERADLILSFGAQTWPHQLVRVMLVEQLYRAVMILTGHPYHRD